MLQYKSGNKGIPGNAVNIAAVHLGKAMILGQPSQKTEELKRILQPNFTEIVQLSELKEIRQIEFRNQFNLIFITDSLTNDARSSLLLSLRKMFPTEMMIGLFDDSNPYIEAGLRSLRLNFYGTYSHFVDKAVDILQQIIESKPKRDLGE